ncbi:helix-turn-helix transcriptional regulator [Aetokthonos hydrillicola Thurmond2011]|uniref:Helix-turn-helix transcriptional regulator n=1 Tax=Aetokthonos hydrillicola Thurmond2011 TaxID=2712845 RepID=A0AAP5IEW8_9CYAN|nr:helix-turn-helix transcriptional regulator [Aetokthonos hydrillicola]MBO3463097.1 helix-turn-helix transcriptional regulator [Aetokthonos hydrillicola CCALA 1050]MDR9900301.1 helix-turn-helix transcriptional regulator [Aetokthonos hydrillicola Thurmond2011]
MAVLITLKKIREREGISQNELARRTGYSLQNVQKIEQGRVSSLTLEALDRFCKALGCAPGDLLEYTPDDDPRSEVIVSDQTTSGVDVLPKEHNGNRKQSARRATGEILPFERKSA